MTSPPSRQHSPKKSFLNPVFAVLATLFLAALGSVALEWGGMVFFWTDEGVRHSQRMLDEHIDYLSTDFRDTVMSFSPIVFAFWLIDEIRDFFVIEWFFASLSSLATHPWLGGMEWLIRLVAELLEAAVNTLCVFVIRLLILLLAAPRLIVYVVVLFVAGFVLHDIRNVSGGREYGFRYHHVKRWLLPSLTVGIFAYLAIPETIHPNWFLLPLTITFSGAVFFWAATFKKKM